MDREVIIRTFPTSEGDTQEHTKLSLLTKEKVFNLPQVITKERTLNPVMPLRVIINGRSVDTFEELLAEAQRTPIEETVEIIRFTPVLGG